MLPYLQRAARLRRSLSGRLAVVHGWTADLLEHLPSGIFLLDKDGRISHANGRGQVLLASRDGLVSRAGKLVAIERTVSQRLDAVLHRCLSSTRRGGDVLIPRIAGSAWLLSVCPLSGTPAELFAAEPACRAWVCVSEPSAARSGLAARLGILFGLTPAQQRVATAPLDGLSPGDIAEAHGVSVATVRTQVQAVFSRVGVQRQADLMRILGAAAALPSLPDRSAHHQFRTSSIWMMRVVRASSRTDPGTK